MKLKRFTAPTMPEAIKMIKNDLGENAVILSTRKINAEGGKKSLEITAAVDQPSPQPPTTKNTDTITKALQDGQQTQAESTTHQTGALYGRLLEHGVQPDIAQRVDKAVSALLETGFGEEDGLEMVLSKMMTFEEPADVLQKERPLVLVGPTGAGKTTTLAKLAVSERMHGSKVALVSMDTYKIGGVEQLAIYADALKENLHVAGREKNFPEIIKDLENYDLVLADCAGANPFEGARLADTQKQVAEVEAAIGLVLPANMNSAEMTTLPRAFAPLQPAHLLFTKLDETFFLGGLINTAIQSGLPICFVTDGQQVPQDLTQLDAKSLSRRLLAKPVMPWEDVEHEHAT